MSVLIVVLTGTIAALVGAGLGFYTYRLQQHSAYASDRFLVGVERLTGSVIYLNGLHLHNNVVAKYILETMATSTSSNFLTLDEDLPDFLSIDWAMLVFTSVLPSEEMLGNQIIGDWTGRLTQAIQIESVLFRFEIRLRTKTLLHAINSGAGGNRPGASISPEITRLKALVDEWDNYLNDLSEIVTFLHELTNCVGKKRPLTMAGYYALKRRKDIAELSTRLAASYSTIENAELPAGGLQF